MSRLARFISRIPVRTRDRLIGGFGFLWNLSIVGGLLLFSDASWLAKLAWAEFGGIVLVLFVGVFRGKHHDPAWERRATLAVRLGFAVFVLLAVLSFFIE